MIQAAGFELQVIQYQDSRFDYPSCLSYDDTKLLIMTDIFIKIV